jgi:hypothetical protein
MNDVDGDGGRGVGNVDDFDHPVAGAAPANQKLPVADEPGETAPAPPNHRLNLADLAAVFGGVFNVLLVPAEFERSRHEILL